MQELPLRTFILVINAQHQRTTSTHNIKAQKQSQSTQKPRNAQKKGIALLKGVAVGVVGGYSDRRKPGQPSQKKALKGRFGCYFLACLFAFSAKSMTKRAAQVAGRGANAARRRSFWRVFLPQKGKKHDKNVDEKRAADGRERSHAQNFLYARAQPKGSGIANPCI